MVKFIKTLSDVVARCERSLLRVLVLAIPVAVLVNVTGRGLGTPIFWLDELAVLSMVCLAMIGLSLTLKTRDAVSVTLLQDAVSPAVRRVLRCISDLFVLAFTIAFLVLCYLWFDPVLLINTGFDIEQFAAESFNFIYDSSTATLGISKIWFWSVLPLTAFTSSIHALENLLQTLTAKEPLGQVNAESGV
jgi:TRAP-type C4-dicarboxylate transport system permease small subunit